MFDFLENPLLQNLFWGNSLRDYLIAIGYFVILWLAFRLLQRLLLSALKKVARRTKNEIDDTLIKIVSQIRPSFYFTLAAYVSLHTLSLNDLAARLVNGAAVIMVVYQIVMSLQIMLDFIVRRKLSALQQADANEEGEGRNLEGALGIINQIAKVVLWSVGLLFILSNLGINITSLVASLGIGGIAAALALQGILGDLFSSLAIYLDKPFAVGDAIKLGEVTGTVENIGIKTTRLRSISGEEVIIPNQELTSGQVTNLKRMKERRVKFQLGLNYSTPSEKVKIIPDLLGDIISRQANVRFDRAHFEEFGDSALIFEIVYHITSREYIDYMNAQQDINLAIKEAFEQTEIELAFPTQTVHLQK